MFGGSPLKFCDVPSNIVGADADLVLWDRLVVTRPVAGDSERRRPDRRGSDQPRELLMHTPEAPRLVTQLRGRFQRHRRARSRLADWPEWEWRAGTVCAVRIAQAPVEEREVESFHRGSK
jgi:hypothetical protein